MSLTISLYFLRALFLSLSYHISSRSSFFAFCLFDISSRGTMYYCSISDNSFSRSLFFFYLFNSSAHLHRPLLLSIFPSSFPFLSVRLTQLFHIFLFYLPRLRTPFPFTSLMVPILSFRLSLNSISFYSFARFIRQRNFYCRIRESLVQQAHW